MRGVRFAPCKEGDGPVPTQPLVHCNRAAALCLISWDIRSTVYVSDRSQQTYHMRAPVQESWRGT
jgi:hypothetical protein